ncbi:RNA polymerase sigma factor [Mariniblastus fucicola]|uniref:ECF RNA polymerase sigma factor SigE n=1 Tax=Mariniblastus fucicola TaxID=980251 RepID=A0A5B9PKJ1_9BACT|nr:sigma-70 family RNA polymerase sigma factor [Mariniblastus fucicola]QEG22923.1 ECF RNA polymerase sigma factor SigE [Mariniblastus fucicola]
MDNSPKTRLSLIGRLHDNEDSEAWSEFVQIYEPLIQAIVQRRGMQYADATEVTQEVLTRVAHSIGTWNPDPSKGTFRGWLYRVTRNLTIDYVRRNKTRTPTEGEIDFDQLAEPSSDDSREFRLEYRRQLFGWAVGQVQPSFKPENWQAFWKTAVEQKSVDEVSRELNISRGRVCVARFRVMTRITAVIKERMQETDE